MFLYFYKNIKTLLKNIKLQMFSVATFYVGHFFKFYVTVIMVHTQ